MKMIYLDCSMGAAGDMLASALLELFPDPSPILEQLNNMGLEGVRFHREDSVKCGIQGTRLIVTVHGIEEGSKSHYDHDHSQNESHHHHHSLSDLRKLVSGLNLPQNVQNSVLAVYDRLANAESKVHGVPVDLVHFHEVGALDALADISAVCLMMDLLSPVEVLASPIHVGSGQIHCAHGILPVPAPATAELLKGVPIYSGEIPTELCTPTGAALLTQFVSHFGPMPPMNPLAYGYGMGKKDLPAANCVRAILGETAHQQKELVELRCNLDDMTGEALGFAMELLLSAGALDVYTVPIGMKKCRPATMLCVLCRQEEKDKLLSLMFAHTSTLGIREIPVQRHSLQRKTVIRSTEFGDLRCKESHGFGVTKTKYEYEDLAKIAKEQGLSLSELLNKLP